MKEYTAQELWDMTRVSPNEAKDALRRTTAYDVYKRRKDRIRPYLDVGMDIRRGDYRIEVGFAGTF